MLRRMLRKPAFVFGAIVVGVVSLSLLWGRYHGANAVEPGSYRLCNGCHGGFENHQRPKADVD